MKILLGMSGGVDSCAAAKILQQQGFEVVGCCLLLTPQSAPDSADVQRARQAARTLGIELIVADYRDLFRAEVIDPFAKAYACGRTPNPCVACNPAVKIASLCRIADENGIEAVATGHYARIDRQTPRLLRSPGAKDQSYFLYRLTADQLKRLYFPLGEYTDKAEIRAFAAQAGFDAASAKDSQEICFLSDGDYAEFIASLPGIECKEGAFLDVHGNRIGTHRGIIHYTAGQRKGLGAFGKPMYVKSVCPNDNTVTLCTAEERFASEITVSDLTWCGGVMPAKEFRAQVRIRSTAKPADALITVVNNTARIVFDTAQLSPSPGQSAVIGDGDVILGGGFID